MNEWEAFNRIQPIGARRYDVYFSHLMVTLHNIAIGFSGNKTAKQFKIEEFVPNWTGLEDQEPEMTPEQIKQFWIEFAEEHNKQVSQRQTTKKDRK